MKKSSLFWSIKYCALLSICGSISTPAQVIPDNTLPDNSVVTPQGDVIQIDGGTTRGTNLFHSFQDFSVPTGNEAFFNNANDISNIFSRVTGGNISNIDGSIGANGTANIFLINPAGIIFGENAFLNVGGSFISSTADKLIFPDGIEYSATEFQNSPILTINVPIGLGFRDEPGDITNFSLFDNGTNFAELVGLRVPEDKTLALIGGNVFIEGGFLSAIGGRIEVGSVAANNTVNLTQVEKGWDFSYEDVDNFQDVSFSFGAFINIGGVNTGDLEIEGSNISLIEGSQIIIDTEEGQSGNLTLRASESIELDGNGLEVDLGDFPTLISSIISGIASGEGSQITIVAPQLSVTNGAQISALNEDDSIGQGIDIAIIASEISLSKPFIDADGNNLFEFNGAGIFATALGSSSGDGGNITIDTETLSVNEAQINTETLGAGNSGDLQINASKSIEVTGVIFESRDDTLNVVSSALFTNVGEVSTATGDAGSITITTPQLTLKDGAQISAAARNLGQGGNITIAVSESILLTGTSQLAEFRGQGRSGITVNVDPSFEDESGTTFATTGDGGNLTLSTPELIIERGAFISADTFSEGNAGNIDINVNQLTLRDGGEIGAGSLLEVSNIDLEPTRGDGGNININATESVEIIGIGEINGNLVNSSLFTLAESNGDASSITLATGNLKIANGGEINASATGTGSAGNIEANASAIDLTDGSIIASINRGEGGNITLAIADNLTLRDNSSISTQALENADGGNINIDSGFVIAVPGGNSDIVANALSGNGGQIEISTQGLFGIESQEELTQGNDISASSEFGLDGVVEINTLEIDPTQGLTELPTAFVIPKPLQGCQANREKDSSSFINTGRGGLPPNPYESLDNSNLFVDVQLPSKWAERSVTDHSSSIKTKPIVEADKWVVNKNGNVELVANDMAATVWKCGDS